MARSHPAIINPAPEAALPGGGRGIRLLALPGPLIALAVAMVAVVGIFDYLTGYEITFFPFYSIPILFVLWFGSKRAAIGISILSAIAWCCADMATGHHYPNEWYRVWDTVVRLMFFCLIVAAGTGFRQQRDASRARIEWLERSQELERQIISISERERRSIGRDLHDDLGQYLVALGFAAEALKKELEKETSTGATAAAQIANQLNQAVIRTRNIARGISPVDENEWGLELALEQLAGSASRLPGISCSFVHGGDVAIRDNTRAMHLYRIAQEALNNAMKHGHAKNIVIALEADDSGLSLRISDDGAGFDPAASENAGMGLNTMRYRARMIGGALEILPNVPHGAVVSCTIAAGAPAGSAEKKFMVEKKTSIVIVEDHTMVREHLVNLINNEPDMEVCGEADNIQQGMELIRYTMPQLAIVDITLNSGTNGLELIKGLKMLSLPVPVLVLSMHEESLYAERALRAGAKGYITKHRASHELLAAIHRVLAGEIYVSDKMVSSVMRKLTSGGNKALAPIDRLTDRELSVLELIGRGNATRAIAESLGLGLATIDTYRARIKEKLNLRNTFELQDYAIRWVRERA